MVVVAYRNSGDIVPGASPLSLPEEDLPPEFCHYHDEGCEYFASCLQCPLPDCLKEVPGGTKSLLKKTRNRYIRIFVSCGWKAREIASLFGVSLRTVQRACKQREEIAIDETNSSL